MCSLGLLLGYSPVYTFPIHRCWPDTGQEARIASVSVAAEKSQALDNRGSHMPPVQAGRPALLQWGSTLSLLQDLWLFLMEKPQNPPSCSSWRHASSHCFSEPGAGTALSPWNQARVSPTSAGTPRPVHTRHTYLRWSFFVPALSVGCRARTK